MQTVALRWTKSYFYPRSPRGERLDLHIGLAVKILFLSTLPARGATGAASDLILTETDFYPRSPRGERLFFLTMIFTFPLFLSTLPARGATAGPQSWGSARSISIHAPREGSDTTRGQKSTSKG